MENHCFLFFIIGFSLLFLLCNVFAIFRLKAALESFTLPQNETKQAVLVSTQEYSSLTPNNLPLIQSGAMHIKLLLQHAEQSKEPVYATLSSPLLGFMIPKTGSNTLLYYILEALARFRLYSNAGCQPPDRSGCMLDPPYLANTSCSVAFDGHFQPTPLIDALVGADKDPNATCHRWTSDVLQASDSNNNDNNAKNIYRQVLQHSVCLIVLRDPIDRAIASYYEWHFKKSSNLTAIEYLNANGARKYIDLVGGSYQKEYTSPMVWEAVLESCLVGVTEDMDAYVTVLSRVLHVPAPVEKVSKKRSNAKPGMNETSVQTFYDQLTPLMHDDINLWKLATQIAKEQLELAKSFEPLVKEVLNKPENSCYYCETCFQQNETWLGIHWTVFDRPGQSSVGFPFDKQGCCKHC